MGCSSSALRRSTSRMSTDLWSSQSRPARCSCSCRRRSRATCPAPTCAGAAAARRIGCAAERSPRRATPGRCARPRFAGSLRRTAKPEVLNAFDPIGRSPARCLWALPEAAGGLNAPRARTAARRWWPSRRRRTGGAARSAGWRCRTGAPGPAA